MHIFKLESAEQPYVLESLQALWEIGSLLPKKKTLRFHKTSKTSTFWKLSSFELYVLQNRVLLDAAG
jgi:hypothetical protein